MVFRQCQIQTWREWGRRGETVSPKNFWALRTSVGSKNKGGGEQAPWALPWICHYQVVAKTEPYVGMVLIL